MTIQEFKNQSISKLKNASPTPILDINVILEHILKWDRTFLLTHSNEELSDQNLKWLETAVEKRLTGLPVAYITGIKSFYGFDFIVTPDVLIPKPDTEILVGRALSLVEEICKKNESDRSLQICDMCTGSGCIGISVVASTFQELKTPPSLTLVDISPKALEVAKMNTKKTLSSDIQKNITFVESNLFGNLPPEQKFDLILTNPPYIPATMVDELLKDGRSEPRLALDGDVIPGGNSSGTSDGMEIIRNLLPQAQNHLADGGRILMETGEYNALETQKLGNQLGFKTTIHRDLEGQLRVVEFFRA